MLMVMNSSCTGEMMHFIAFDEVRRTLRPQVLDILNIFDCCKELIEIRQSTMPEGSRTTINDSIKCQIKYHIAYGYHNYE